MIPKKLTENKMQKNNTLPARKVVLSIHKNFLDKILAGEKTIEVRRSFPKKLPLPFTILFYETGNGGGTKRIRAKATCNGFDLLHIADFQREQMETLKAFSQKSCLSHAALSEYIGQRQVLFGWRLENIVPLDSDLDEVGVRRAPQSWCYTYIER